jgi:hypothetical protein
MKRLALALALGTALAPGAHALEYTALRPGASGITFAYQQMGVGLEGRFTIRRGDFAIGEGAWSAFDVVANDVLVTFRITADSGTNPQQGE